MNLGRNTNLENAVRECGSSQESESNERNYALHSDTEY